MMELLLKLAAGAVIAALCAVMLRKNAPEFAMLIMLAAGAWILISAIGALSDVLSVLARFTRFAGVESQLIEPVLKVVGLSITTHIATEVCRAAGEGGIAAFVQTAGTILALAAAVPLAAAVLETITGMLP